MDTLDPDNVPPFVIFFKYTSSSTIHTHLHPLLLDFFILFSILMSGCTRPQQILVCRCMWSKDCWWPSVTLKQSKSEFAQYKHLNFLLPDFTSRAPAFSGRCVHGAPELRSGRTATLHASGALQGQSVQHPCALHTSHSAVRPGKGEERRGGAGQFLLFLVLSIKIPPSSL